MQSSMNENQQRNTISTRAVNIQQQFQVSLICRNGPIPEHNRSCTDFVCTAIFFTVLLSTLIFAMIDFTHIKFSIESVTIHKMMSDNMKSIPNFLLQSTLSALALIAIGIVLTTLYTCLPIIMPFLFIFLFIATLAASSMYFFFIGFSGQQINSSQQIIKIFMGVFFAIGVAVLIIFVIRKIARISKLGSFGRVNSTIIRNNCCALPLTAVLLSLFEIVFWWMMTNLFFLASNLSQEATIPPFVMMFATLVLWFWSHGLLIAISDFLFPAITINWYFSKQDPDRQILMPSLSLLFRYHFGTTVFGAILAYIPEYILGKVRKNSEQQWVKLGFFWLKPFKCLTKYCYVQTILQGFNFWTSNKYLLSLRKQIKYHFPKIYMIGHLMGDIMKVFMCLVGGGIMYFLLQSTKQGLVNSLWIPLIPISVSMFGLFLQIATNFANLMGKIGDVGLICYGIDLKIERTYYGNNNLYSCPQDLLKIFRSMSTERPWDGVIHNEQVEPRTDQYGYDQG